MLALFFALAAEAQPRVINDGFSGENTAELDARLDGALREFRPAYVVLFAGTNDALNEKKFLSPKETEEHLAAMVRRVEVFGAKAVMVTVHDPDVTRLMLRHSPEVYAGSSPLKLVAMVNARVRRRHTAQRRDI